MYAAARTHDLFYLQKVFTDLQKTYIAAFYGCHALGFNKMFALVQWKLPLKF